MVLSSKYIVIFSWAYFGKFLPVMAVSMYAHLTGNLGIFRWTLFCMQYAVGGASIRTLFAQGRITGWPFLYTWFLAAFTSHLSAGPSNIWKTGPVGPRRWSEWFQESGVRIIVRARKFATSTVPFEVIKATKLHGRKFLTFILPKSTQNLYLRKWNAIPGSWPAKYWPGTSHAIKSKYVAVRSKKWCRLRSTRNTTLFPGTVSFQLWKRIAWYIIEARPSFIPGNRRASTGNSSGEYLASSYLPMALEEITLGLMWKSERWAYVWVGYYKVWLAWCCSASRRQQDATWWKLWIRASYFHYLTLVIIDQRFVQEEVSLAVSNYFIIGACFPIVSISLRPHNLGRDAQAYSTGKRWRLHQADNGIQFPFGSMQHHSWAWACLLTLWRMSQVTTCPLLRPVSPCVL